MSGSLNILLDETNLIIAFRIYDKCVLISPKEQFTFKEIVKAYHCGINAICFAQ